MTRPDPIATRRLDPILRLLMWSGLLGLWLLPLIAKQFTDEVQWSTMDHVFWFFMLAIPGAVIEVVSRLTSNWSYRGGVGIALAIAWANLAVGIVGNEDNPINLVFFGVVAIAVFGSILVGFKASRMRWVFLATAAAQALSALVALQAEPFVWVFCGITSALWLAAATLFGRAAEAQTVAGAPPA